MAPRQWAQTVENIQYISLRQCVFKIESASANHTSRIIYNKIDKKKHLYDLLNDFHAEFSSDTPGGADELRQLIKDARCQWAIQLRETGCRDIQVVIEHENFGDGIDKYITARFKAIKDDLVKVGGDAYHHYPFNAERNITIFSIVVPQASLETVLTRQRMAAHAISFADITAPAPELVETRDPDPGCEFWFRNTAEPSKVTVLPTPKGTIRHRSNTIEKEIRQAPPGAWDPYHRPQTVAQQQSWKGRKPFSFEVYEPESNYNWIEKDFAERCKLLDEYDQSPKSSAPTNDEGAIDDEDDGFCQWPDSYPRLSSKYPRNNDLYSDKHSIADVQRDYREVEAEIAELEANYENARGRLDAVVKRGVMTREEMRNCQERHNVLYAQFQLNKLPALRQILGSIAVSLQSARCFPQKEKKNRIIKQSRNGSTIWEESLRQSGIIVVNEEAQGVTIDAPPAAHVEHEPKPKSKSEGNWAWLQRMVAGAGRKKPQPAVIPPAIMRRDSAVSFSAGVAADITTGGIGDRQPGPAVTALRAALYGTAVARPDEEDECEETYTIRYV